MRELKDNDIAIIGYAFELPEGINTNEKLWDVLKNRQDLVREIPAKRWDWRQIYDENPQAEGKSYSYHGAFLKDIEQFDPSAFRIMPVEAKSMDPQQRLVLQAAWHAMENSYLNIEQLKHSDTGVFIGATMVDYLQLQVRMDEGKHIDRYTHFGSILNDISGRVSYVFGFRGPSLTIDTACSSSLTAIDAAIKALKEGDCEMALAGGVNVILTEEMYIKLARAEMLSKTGACKTFDDTADGYVRGEGCGILVLQNLKNARETGKRILAVIRGSSINHNGNSGGLTVPSGKSQTMLLQSCLKKAGVKPEEIDYVEAHGTGTQLGDKIEVNALQDVFKGRKNPLLIGSIKTNMGHLESAAGVAGVIKVLLCMEHNELVPGLHLKHKNTKINWDDSPVDVLKENILWEKTIKLAGVSAFGASGTNGHIIMQKYQDEQPAVDTKATGKIYLAVSAKSKISLQKILISLSTFIKDKEERELHEIARIYNVTRSGYEERVVVSGVDKDELVAALNGKIDEALQPEKPKEVQDASICVLLCNLGNSRKAYEQLEAFSFTYRQLSKEMQEQLSLPTEDKSDIMRGIAFCRYVAGIGFKKYQIAGDELVKFQVMLASKDSPAYETEIERYLNKEAALSEELAGFISKIYVWSDCAAADNQYWPEILLENAALQYQTGAKIRWEYFYDINKIKLLFLPGYEFDNRYYWLNHQRHLIDDLNRADRSSEYLTMIKPSAIDDDGQEEADNGQGYRFRLRRATRLVEQHQIGHREVLVGSFQIILIKELASRLLGDRVVIKDLFFVQTIEPETERLLKLRLEANPETGTGRYDGRIWELSDDNEWVTKTLFACLIKKDGYASDTAAGDEEFRGEIIGEQTFYHALFHAGLYLGSDYQIMDAVVKGEREAIAVLKKTDFEPAVLDSASQLLYLFRGQGTDLYLPYYFASYEQWETLKRVNRVEARLLNVTEDEITAELSYYTDSCLTARFNDYHLKKIKKRELWSLDHIIGKRSGLPDGTELRQYHIKLAGTSLQDHQVYHRLTIPGSYFISQVMQFAMHKFPQAAFELSDISFFQAMVPDENVPVKEMITARKNDTGYVIDICSAYGNQDEFIKNAAITVTPRQDLHVRMEPERMPERSDYGRHVERAKIIEIQAKIGLQLGGSFNWMQDIWVGEDSAFAELANDDFAMLKENYGTPPGLIDTSAQVLGFIKNSTQEEAGAYIPLTINRLIQYQNLKNRLYCLVRNVKENGLMLVGDILYCDPDTGQKVLEFQGMTLMKADRNKLGSIKSNNSMIYEESWDDFSDGISAEAISCRSAVEIRLGIDTKKIIISKYRAAEKEWLILDKIVLDWEDKAAWKEAVIKEINCPEQLLVILSDSSVGLPRQVPVARISEINILITHYYLELFTLLHKIDFSSHVLCVVTNQVYSRDAAANLFGSLVWGMVRSIQLELAEEKIVLLDSDRSAFNLLPVLGKLVRNHIMQVTYYQGTIRTPSLATTKADELSSSAYRFAAEKSYLVIGGFGALGLETCKYMIEAGVRRLIVIGSSSQEQRQPEYDSLHEMQDGLDLRYYQLDIAADSAAAELYPILSAENRLGGIIYAAGVVKDKMFANYTDDEIRSVYGAKINGMLTLAKILDNIEYDFCVGYSSVVGVIGAAGQSVYGAANSFIDALCRSKRAQGKNMFTIQWGPWSEIGMFSKVNNLAVKRFADRKIFAMEPQEAMARFLVSLKRGTNQMIVNNKQIALEKKGNITVFDHVEESVKERLKKIVAQAIGTEQAGQIEESRRLMDFGIDSLLMIEIRIKINKIFHVSITLDEFFNEMTIEKLAARIEYTSK